MLAYPNQIKDHLTDRAFRKLIDFLNSLGDEADEINKKCGKLHVPTMSEIQMALQQGGSNPLNLTGLQPPCPPAGGGGGGATSFSDPLNVTDPINANAAMGSNWITALKNPANTNALQWGVPNTSPGNKLTYANTNQTSPLTGMRLVCIPIPVLTGLYGKKQFAQATVATLAGGVNDVTGLGVLGYHSDLSLTGYVWGIRGDGSWTMYRGNSESFTSLGTGAAGAVVNGNVVRISGDPTVGGQVTIVLTIAGSVVSTIIDNAAAIITVGTPYMHCLVSESAGNTTWSTFSCGLGL